MPNVLSSYARATVALNFENQTSPDLYCPVTRKLILPGFAYFGAAASGDEFDYDAIETVMFVLVAGEPHYLSAALGEAIEDKRRELEKAGDIEDVDDLSDCDVIAEHLDLGPAALVLSVTWERDSNSVIIIGLDLGAPV